jgi:hypothetical protein
MASRARPSRSRNRASAATALWRTSTCSQITTVAECKSCRTLTLKFIGAIPAAMTRSDLEVANDFLRRWHALSKQRRARHGGKIPVAALQVAALSHPDLAIRRSCFFLLDHYASAGAEKEKYWGAWAAYTKALRDAGVMTSGHGLQPPTTSTTVRLRDGKRQVQDGPFADTLPTL